MFGNVTVEVLMLYVDRSYADGFVFMWCTWQICLFCRQRGHSLKNCQKKNENDMEAKLCYNCGETGHSLPDAPYLFRMVSY